MENMKNKNIYMAVIAIVLILLIGFLIAGKKETSAPTTKDLNTEETSQQQEETQESSTPIQPVVKPSTNKPAVSVTNLPPATVRYTADGFSPTTVTITKGGSVQFINDSNSQMWVASNPHPSHSAYPAFDQRTSVGRGGTYTFTFTEIGKWYFHNHLNSSRTGLVIVK